MRWRESQIETRTRLDVELTERAYAKLASSVTDSRYIPRVVFNDVEATDAAVKTCLSYYGQQPGEVPDSITSPQERIDYLCRPLGVMYREVSLTGVWYKDAIGAMLGKLDTGETVAILPGTLSGYTYVEPGTNRRVKITAEVAAHIEPDAILFYLPFPDRALNVRYLVRFISGIFDRSDYFFVLFAVIASTLVGLLPAMVNKLVFGTVVPSGQNSLIAPIGMLLLGVAISRLLIGVFQNLIMARVSSKLQVITEAATFARVLSLPTSFFKQYASGNLASRIAQVTQLVSLITSMLLGAGISAFFSMIYLLQIVAYAPVLFVPALIAVLAQAVATIASVRITARREQATMESSVRLSGTVTALLNGIAKIKLAGAEDRAFVKWADDFAEYAHSRYNRPKIMTALPAIVTVIGMVGTAAIYYFAGTTHVTLSDYMAFNVAYGNVTGALASLAALTGSFGLVGPMLKMVEPIFEATPEKADDKPNVNSLTGSIEVNNVAFRYNINSPYLLDNLSFKIRPGEYVALVGKSGCGKSTILRLLLGFEIPERGSIFYGPYDTSRVDLQSLRQHIGTVTQDGKLFMGDIFSNITISTPGATLDDAWEAAEIAGIADDIRNMPMGMHTLISEGSGGVSGGQRQRLMIARAVCGKRRILMFDEATSALDNVTQRHVTDALEQLNCTRIVVAHRLSTVRHCDRILVIDKGTIVEEGSYDELIERNGAFAELVERQRLEGE